MFWIWSSFYSNIAGCTLSSYKNIEVPNKIFCFNNQSVSSGLVRIVQNLSLKSFWLDVRREGGGFCISTLQFNLVIIQFWNNIILPKYFKSCLYLFIMLMSGWGNYSIPSHLRINKMAVFLPGSILVGHEQLKFTLYFFQKEWPSKVKLMKTEVDPKVSSNVSEST